MTAAGLALFFGTLLAAGLFSLIRIHMAERREARAKKPEKTRIRV